MKKSIVAIIVFILIISLFSCGYWIYNGYLFGPQRFASAVTSGIIREYNIHNSEKKPRANIKLEGDNADYTVSETYYDRLVLQNQPLRVGQHVDLVYDANTKGGTYLIVEIATDEWNTSVKQSYLDSA